MKNTKIEFLQFIYYFLNSLRINFKGILKKSTLIICLLLIFSGQVKSICSGTYSYSANDVTSTFSSPNSTGGMFSSTTIYIPGTLTVDMNYEFNKANIILAPGAKIVIPQGYKLTFDECWLHSCDGTNMWDKIEMTGSSGLGLEIKNGTLIEDAETAISNTGNSEFTISNSQFNKNFNDINLTSLSVNSTNHTSSIVGTTFSCYSTYNNPSTRSNCLLAPYSGERTNYGITLTKFGKFKIGDSNYGMNIFDNLIQGIYGDKTDLTVRNNKFQYITPNFSVGGGGFAIGATCASYTSSNILIVGGTGYKEGNKFDKCNIGVLTYQGYDADIQVNEFTECTYPIHIRHLSWQSHASIDVKIKHNILVNFLDGITINTSGRLKSVLISSNELNYTSDNLTFINRRGIFCMGTVGYKIHDISIEDNLISNCENGMYLTLIGKPANNSVHKNTIRIPSTTNSGAIFYGIRAARCEYVNFDQNEIKKLYSATTFNTEILALERSPGCKVSYNLLTDNNTSSMPTSGIHFLNTCIATNLYCNNIVDCNKGVNYGLSGFAATATDQGSSSQAWDNQWDDPSSGTPWRISGYSNNIYWYYRNGSGTPYQAITNNTSVLTVSGINNGSPCSYSNSHFINREIDLLPIINSTISYPDHSDENTYSNKLLAFQLLYNDSDLLIQSTSDDSIYTNFVSEQLVGNAGAFEEVIKLISLGSFSEALSTNDAIDKQNDIEYYLQTFYHIYISSLLIGDGLSSQDSSDLSAIACLNSIEGGDAVYFARNIIDPSMSDNDACGGRIGHFSSNIVRENSLQVFPNPVIGSITVSSALKENSSISILFYDLQGKIIHSKHLCLEQGIATVDLSTFSDGVYFITIFTDSQEVFHSKLVVLK
jgi:hypothetical protein